MPFTLAHPAAVLFVRRRFPWSALAIGSMTPDFSKYFALSPSVNLGHSWPAILWFCVPAGLVTLWIFHGFLKMPLFALLPRWHQERLASITESWSFGPARRFIVITAALAIGAASHLAWDGFTHHDGFAVELISALQTEVFRLRDHPIHAYKILQHGSTAVGLAALMLCYLFWARRAPVAPLNDAAKLSSSHKFLLVCALCGLAAIIGASYGWNAARGIRDIHSFKLFAGKSAVATMAVFATEIFLFSIVYRSILRPAAKVL